jgi:hypothetical protein
MGKTNISQDRGRGQPYDWRPYDLLKAQHPNISRRALAKKLNISESTLRGLEARRHLSSNGALPVSTVGVDTPVMHSAVYSAVPVQTSEELAMVTRRLTALETNLPQRVDALEAWVATLQTRFSASGPSLPVQSGAVHSAAPTFDDPDDAKAERWNIWIPRGLRKRIEAQAAMLGVSASRHLQTMLWRALQAEEVRHDA